MKSASRPTLLRADLVVPQLGYAAPVLAWHRLPRQTGLLSALNGIAMSDSPTLYERLGGEDMISNLIPAFYVKVLADAELAPFFRHTAIEKLHDMQRDFFAMATGGPISYSGRPLAHAHHGRGISKHHFALFTTHLVDTLLDMGVTQTEADEVIDRVNTFVNEVTGTSY